MSKNEESLVAVKTTEWDAKHEAKLQEALRQYPIIYDWLVDAQADAVEEHAILPVSFEENSQRTAVVNAYAKGRISQLMELVGTAKILMKEPDSE